MENNNHNQHSAIYNSNRANNTGIQGYPTAQLSGSTDNNIHREYSDNSYYNTTLEHLENRHYQYTGNTLMIIIWMI